MTEDVATRPTETDESELRSTHLSLPKSGILLENGDLIRMTMTGGKLVYVNPNQDPDQEVKYYRYPARTSYLD